MPSLNYLKMDDETRSRCVDGWQKAMPYIVGILSVSMVITISMLSSAFHQIHTLEAWRKHDFASTLLRMNKTLGQLEAKAGPQGRQGVQGAQGAPGKDGAQGPPGPPGPKGENDSTCNGINFYGTNPILIVELKKIPLIIQIGVIQMGQLGKNSSSALSAQKSVVASTCS